MAIWWYCSHWIQSFPAHMLNVYLKIIVLSLINLATSYLRMFDKSLHLQGSYLHLHSHISVNLKALWGIRPPWNWVTFIPWVAWSYTQESIAYIFVNGVHYWDPALNNRVAYVHVNCFLMLTACSIIPPSKIKYKNKIRPRACSEKKICLRNKRLTLFGLSRYYIFNLTVIILIVQYIIFVC